MTNDFSDALQRSYPPPRIASVLASMETCQLLYVVAKLGIPDRLASGPKSAEELAKETGTHERSLLRVMRALAMDEFFIEDEQGRFTLTPDTAALRTGARGSARAVAIMTGEPWYWQMYGGLLETVKTGKNAFEAIHGMTVYQYLAQNPEAGQLFDEYMEEVSAPWDWLLLAAFDFSGFGKVADIGGGRATLLTQLLKAYPSMTGVLCDQPAVTERARSRVEADGLADRFELVGGSFFESVPPGADAYLIRNVLHDWDDDHALVLLKNCRAAMKPTAVLLIVEVLLAEGPTKRNYRYSDIQVMVGLGGCQRTAKEFEQLLSAAGLELGKITDVGPWLNILEARPR